VPVLAQIPYDSQVAVLYSRGIPLWAGGERFREIFRNLWKSIESRMSADR
jgi:hypothetical protein